MMDILNKEKFPPIGYNETIRIALVHQNKLLEIRKRAKTIEKKNPNYYIELKEFLKFCIETTK